MSRWGSLLEDNVLTSAEIGQVLGMSRQAVMKRYKALGWRSGR